VAVNSATSSSAAFQCPHLRALAGLQKAEATSNPVAAPSDRFETKAAAEPGSAPDHTWLAKELIHTPVPKVQPEAWANAKHFDVMIVGGGMGGLYTAWKLEGLDGSAPASENHPKVGIYERTRHFGGRVHSATVEGAAVPMDVGAMRYIPSQHHLLNGLAEHFKLETHEFQVGGENNLQYYRGKRLTNREVEQNPDALPYNLAPNEKGKSADDLLAMVIESVVPNFKTMTPEELEQATKEAKVEIKSPSTGQLVSVPLVQLGFRNLLAHNLSNEAVKMLTDVVGYESDLQNWDAGQAIMELSADFRKGVVYSVPVQGMGVFPEGLTNELKAAGTEMTTGQTLRQVDYDKEKKEFHLTFEDRKGNAVPVVAEQVVLNLPKVPLKAVIEDSPFLQGTAAEQTLGKVTANPLTRIFATFEKPWWNEMGIESGRTMSDLNLGQVYYYGKQGDTKPYVEIYNDGSKSEFWEGLQNPANPGVTTTMTVTPQLAQEVKKELEELHGREIPAPTSYVYKRWADPFFGAGWHTWNAGSKPLETAEKMVQPVDKLPLFVCGEAFSNAQGWIEGALQSSERVLAHMSAANP
jgi:monoamine oxidase